MNSKLNSDSAEVDGDRSSSQCENYFTEMCSGFEAGSYLRLTVCVYHSTLGLRVIKKKVPPAPAGRRGNKLKDVKDFPHKNGWGQGQNLAVTVLIVPNSLDSGQSAGEDVHLRGHLWTSLLSLQVVEGP